MSPDLICLGEPLMEFNQIGAAGEATYQPGFGGDTSNTAIAAARQGVRTGYLTALGTDAFGDRFMALWRAEGVDTSQVRRNPRAHTGIYFITLGEPGGEPGGTPKGRPAAPRRSRPATALSISGPVPPPR